MNKLSKESPKIKKERKSIYTETANGEDQNRDVYVQSEYYVIHWYTHQLKYICTVLNIWNDIGRFVKKKQILNDIQIFRGKWGNIVHKYML